VILTTLTDAAPYEALESRIAAGLRWLRGMDPSIADGRHPIDGDDVFALVSTYETGPSTEKRFETHRRHVDLQYVADGHERILHAPPPRSPWRRRTTRRRTSPFTRSRPSPARC